MVILNSLNMVSYSHSIVTMALSCIFSDIKRAIGRTSFLPRRGKMSDVCLSVRLSHAGIESKRLYILKVFFTTR